MNRRLKTSLKDDATSPDCQGFQPLQIFGTHRAALTGSWEAQARRMLARSRDQVPVADHEIKALPDDADDAT